ncbi:MAG: type II toxin-antitoxin system PemK/MazF family toxin [Spirochaetes bacterium]|nr:MAG: type II toxin-antitoxin system PemK/MazF family toxin [Spirochaetota bacterium]
MKRGEIWKINLDPTIGAEIQKSRPAVILSVNSVGVLPLRIIVPLTSWKNHYSNAAWLVHLEPENGNGLRKKSAADTLQIRSISESRFLSCIGEVSGNDLIRIEKAARIVLGL